MTRPTYWPGRGACMARLAWLALIIPLNGCAASLLSSSLFGPRSINPVIADAQNPGLLDASYSEVVSSAPGRRSIFIGYKSPDGQPLQRPAVCPEPPPDAPDVIANAVSNAPILPPGRLTVTGAAVQAPQVAAVGASTGLGAYRSQGLQLLRDQTYQLCLRAMETNMDAREWDTEQAALIADAMALIQAEMPAVVAAASRPYFGSAPAAPPPPSSPPPNPDFRLQVVSVRPAGDGIDVHLKLQPPGGK